MQLALAFASREPYNSKKKQNIGTRCALSPISYCLFALLKQLSYLLMKRNKEKPMKDKSVRQATILMLRFNREVPLLYPEGEERVHSREGCLQDIWRTCWHAHTTMTPAPSLGRGPQTALAQDGP